MANVVFLCSGNGGNLKFIHYANVMGAFSEPLEVSVIADRDCGAHKFALENGLRSTVVRVSRMNQLGLKEAMTERSPKVVVTNIHKVIDADIVDRFQGKMINLHYSVLPAFGGTIGSDAVDRALNYGSTIIGATVHYVEVEVDAGRPIAQCAMPVTDGRDLHACMNRVFRASCLMLYATIEAMISGKYLAMDDCVVRVLDGSPVLFSPGFEIAEEIYNPTVWERLQQV